MSESKVSDTEGKEFTFDFSACAEMMDSMMREQGTGCACDPKKMMETFDSAVEMDEFFSEIFSTVMKFYTGGEQESRGKS